MVYLDERQTVIEWTDDWMNHGRGTAGRALGATMQQRYRPAADGHGPPCPYRAPFWIAATFAAVSFTALAISSLAERPGDWVLAIAGAPGFAINPDVADAIAGAEWLGPSIRGGSFVDVIGAAIVAVTLIALLALRIRQRMVEGTWDGGEDAAGVYKIVTNQTKADDRRSVAWHEWASSPPRERVKSIVCG